MNLEQLLEVALVNCRLDRGEPLLLAVSGGPDSLCLLDALARLEFSITAAHFDHGLRPESAEEAEAVRRQAERLGVPFLSGRQDVAAYARQERLSLEEAARVLRYQFLFAQARQISAQAVVVGHTADDQVETVLMHLLRGAGLSGLKGMDFRALLPGFDERIPLARPLLPFSRADTVEYCRQRGLQPLIDPTNADVAFLRNRVRHELIPLLETYNPQARQAIWRMSRLLTDEDAVLQAAEEQAWQDCFARQDKHAVALCRAAFLAQPAGLQRRLIRRAINQIQPAVGHLRDIDYAAVERALGWAAAPGSGQVDLAQGTRLFVEGDLLWIARENGPAPSPDWPQLTGAGPLPLPVPGSIDLSSSWRLSGEWKGAQEAPSFQENVPPAHTAWLDADAIDGPLAVRTARPGDRFQPLGMEGHSVKLSDFWVNEKLPRRARQNWPLVVSGDKIVWVPGYRLAHPYRVRADTRRLLVLHLERVENKNG